MSSPNEVQQATAALRENRVDDALAILQGAVAKAPDDFAANHLLGLALGKAGRRPEAIARLLTATRINPSSAAAQTHLGLAYAAADKPEQARKAYETALRVEPHFTPAQNALSRLPAPATPAPLVASAPLDPPAPMPYTAPKAAAKKPGKPAQPAKPKVEVDYAEWTLRVLGALFLFGGVYLRFVVTDDGFHFYRLPGYICMVIGISMLKAGFPSENDWKNDFK